MMEKYYKRALLGRAKVADGVVRIPKRVIENFGIKKGDVLEFYPQDTVFPDKEAENLMAVLIVRATTAGGTSFG